MYRTVRMLTLVAVLFGLTARVEADTTKRARRPHGAVKMRDHRSSSATRMLTYPAPDKKKQSHGANKLVSKKRREVVSRHRSGSTRIIEKQTIDAPRRASSGRSRLVTPVGKKKRPFPIGTGPTFPYPGGPNDPSPIPPASPGPYNPLPDDVVPMKVPTRGPVSILERGRPGGARVVATSNSRSNTARSSIRNHSFTPISTGLNFAPVGNHGGAVQYKGRISNAIKTAGKLAGKIMGGIIIVTGDGGSGGDSKGGTTVCVCIGQCQGACSDNGNSKAGDGGDGGSTNTE